MTVKAYQDEDRLRELYVDRRLSLREVAEHFPVSRETIRRWLDRHGIERRSIRHPSIHVDGHGYEWVKNEHGQDVYTVRIHRLLAVAEYGFDAVVDKDIHHKNAISWDNRPSNIEVLSTEDHRRKHADDKPRDEDGNFVSG